MAKKFFRLLYPRISFYKTTELDWKSILDFYCIYWDLSTCVSDKFNAEANSTLSGVDKYLWASNRLSSPHSWWSEKTVLAFRRRHCLPDSEENKEENGMPKRKGIRPFKMVTKGHSFCKQCLHDLQFMKTRSSSPNFSKLARADISRKSGKCFTQSYIIKSAP